MYHVIVAVFAKFRPPISHTFFTLVSTCVVFVPLIFDDFGIFLSRELQAGDYDLVYPSLVWIFFACAQIVAVLYVLRPRLIFMITQVLQNYFSKLPVFLAILSLVIFSRLAETFSCFVWGYDSYHWVATNYIRPSFLKAFYEIFVGETNIAKEAPLLQNLIGGGQICQGFDMVRGVQAQQLFYFLSLFLLIVVLRYVLLSPLAAILVSLLICSGSITGNVVSFRSYLSICFAGFIFGLMILSMVRSKSKPAFGFLSLVPATLMLPSLILFDSTAFPGQEVMSESLYLGLLNILAALCLLLSHNHIRSKNRLHLLTLTALLGTILILTQTRLQGIAVFVCFLLYLLIKISRELSRGKPFHLLILLISLSAFLSLQSSVDQPEEPMTYWGTASIALDFINGENIGKFNERDRNVITRSLDKISQIKKRNLDAGLPNDSQNLNPLYQALIPAFDEEFSEGEIDRNQVFRSITLTSFKVSTFDWLKFAAGNFFEVLGFSTDTYYAFGLIPIVNFPFSTIFYSPLILLLFIILISQAVVSVRKQTLNSSVLIFPSIFLLEILACSTFGVPLSRYVRLTESFLFIFIIVILFQVSRPNYFEKNKI